MTPARRFARRELAWITVVVAAMLLPVVTVFLGGALWEVGLGHWFGDTTPEWIVPTVILPLGALGPTLFAASIVWIRALRRDAPFDSRRHRLRFHAMAAYLGVLVPISVVGLLGLLGRDADGSRAVDFFLGALVLPIQSLVLALPVFVLLYWPRLVFPSLSGLASEGGTATSRSPRS